MYGARIKAQSNSLATNSGVLYSKPEWINDMTKEDTVLEWIEKTANLDRQALELTEHEAEIEMKKSTDCSATNQQIRIRFCRLYQRFLRLLRL